MNNELNTTELDTVAGGTSYQEAFANMAKWNAAITAAGEAAILFTPIKSRPGDCPRHHQT